MKQNEVVATVNNDNKEETIMKKLGGFKKKLVAGAAGAIMAVNMLPIQVFAATGGATGGTADASAITAPLDSLKTLVIAVIGAVGVIILAKNVMEFAQAYQQQDSSTMNSALKGIVAGIMMAGISTVLTFLGF
ncbi:MAG: electron transporter RnfA [Lachnospiraceae bacterium]|nr:electron transporter RnfA [Lachnospiraceae bacterium]